MKGRALTCMILGTVFALAALAPTATPGGAGGGETMGFPPGWTSDFLLTPFRGNIPSIAISGSNIHLFYQNGSNSELYYARSTNLGISWDKNSIFTPDDVPYSAFAKVAVNGNHIHLVWQDTRLQWPTPEVFYQRSEDNGETWNTEFNLSLDDDETSQNPSIACSGQNVHVVWEDLRDGNYEIYYKRSIDGGTTWDDGLGNVGEDRRLTFSTDISVGAYIAADENRVHLIYSMWTSDFGKYETMYMNSTDNGTTWSAPVMLSTHDGFHSDAQAIAVNGSGGVHVVWWESKYGNEEIGYRNSTDNGVTWNPEVRLTNDPNHSQQPDIAINNSHVFVTWMDDRDHYDWTGTPSGAFELYYKESFDSGVTWSNDTRLTYAVNNSIQPCVAMDADYIHVAWADNRTDGSREQIFYKRYPDIPAEDNLTLQHGWNLISFPVEQPALNATPITNASSLCDATGCTNTAKWNATNQNYTNYIAGFDNPGEPNDFTIGEDDGVWVWWDDIENGSFSITGFEPGSRNVHLLPGWNVIAYKSATPGDVETIWASQVQSGIYDDICYWDGQTFRHYIFPTTEMALIPTRGYFVWSDVETWLSY